MSDRILGRMCCASIVAAAVSTPLFGCAFIAPRAACKDGHLCNPLADPNPPPGGVIEMDHARKYVQNTADQFIWLETEVDFVSAVTNLLLLGATIATPVSAAFHASQQSIVGLGLGTSGLLGLDMVLGTDKKGKILDQGLEALACVERNALGMETGLSSKGTTENKSAREGALEALAKTFITELSSPVMLRELAQPPFPAATPRVSSKSGRPNDTRESPTDPSTVVGFARIQGALTAVFTESKSAEATATARMKGAVEAARTNAPQLLVARVTVIRNSVFALMHAAEPTAQQVVDRTEGLLRKAQEAANKAEDAAEKANANAAFAASIAGTEGVRVAASELALGYAAQEQAASELGAVISALLKEAEACKALIASIGRGA